MLLPPCDLLIGAMKGLECPLASCSPNIHKSWLMQSANIFYAICKYSRLFSLAIIGIAGISRIAHCCRLATPQWWQIIGAITIAVKGLQSADPWFLLLTMMMIMTIIMIIMLMTKKAAYSMPLPSLWKDLRVPIPFKEKYAPPANTCPIKWKSMKGVQDRRIGVKCTLMWKVIHPPTRGNFVVKKLWKSAFDIVFNAFL